MEHGLQFVCCWLLHCGKFARRFLESKLFLKEIKCNIQICPCKGIQNSPGFWIPHREFPIPATWFPFFSVELGFWDPWVPVVGRILDSLSYIPHSIARDSGFHEQNFPAFRNPESGFPHRGQFKTSPNFKTVDVRMNRIPPETKMYVLLPYPLAPGSFAFCAKSKCQFFPRMPTDR